MRVLEAICNNKYVKILIMFFHLFLKLFYYEVLHLEAVGKVAICMSLYVPPNNFQNIFQYNIPYKNQHNINIKYFIKNNIIRT